MKKQTIAKLKATPTSAVTTLEVSKDASEKPKRRRVIYKFPQYSRSGK